MITTNLPQLVAQMNLLGNVNVHDGLDTIALQLPKAVDVQQVDDLVCDALFADPIAREESRFGWTIHLNKREHLRSASDMSVIPQLNMFGYVLRPVA